MHDLRWIRENPDAFDRGLLRRGLSARAEEVLAIDREWRGLETQAQESQATRNRLSREIGARPRGEPIEELLHQVEGRKQAEAATAPRRPNCAGRSTTRRNPAQLAGAGGARRPGRKRQQGASPPRRAAALHPDPLPHETIGEARADGFSLRRPPVGVALVVLKARWRASNAPLLFHARPAYRRVRLHRDRAALAGAGRRRIRHR
jgi:hypothetical protein